MAILNQRIRLGAFFLFLGMILGVGSGCDCTSLEKSGWTLSDAPGYSAPEEDADTGALTCPPGKVLERWVTSSASTGGRTAKCRAVTDCDTGISKSGSEYVKKIACAASGGSSVKCASKTVSVTSQ